MLNLENESKFLVQWALPRLSFWALKRADGETSKVRGLVPLGPDYRPWKTIWKLKIRNIVKFPSGLGWFHTGMHQKAARAPARCAVRNPSQGTRDLCYSRHVVSRGTVTASGNRVNSKNLPEWRVCVSIAFNSAEHRINCQHGWFWSTPSSPEHLHVPTKQPPNWETHNKQTRYRDLGCKSKSRPHFTHSSCRFIHSYQKYYGF